MAGIAAAAATAATIADPGAAARIKEAGKVKGSDDSAGHRETVPLDVLDRLDADSDADADGNAAPDASAP